MPEPDPDNLEPDPVEPPAPEPTEPPTVEDTETFFQRIGRHLRHPVMLGTAITAWSTWGIKGVGTDASDELVLGAIIATVGWLIQEMSVSRKVADEMQENAAGRAVAEAEAKGARWLAEAAGEQVREAKAAAAEQQAA